MFHEFHPIGGDVKKVLLTIFSNISYSDYLVLFICMFLYLFPVSGRTLLIYFFESFPLFSKAFLWKIAEVKKATTEVIAFFFAPKPIISKPSEEPHQSLPETSFLPL